MNTSKVTRSGLRQTGRIWYFSPEKLKNLNDLYVMKNESMDFDKFAYFVFAFKLICEWFDVTRNKKSLECFDFLFNSIVDWLDNCM